MKLLIPSIIVILFSCVHKTDESQVLKTTLTLADDTTLNKIYNSGISLGGQIYLKHFFVGYIALHKGSYVYGNFGITDCYSVPSYKMLQQMAHEEVGDKYTINEVVIISISEFLNKQDLLLLLPDSSSVKK